MESQFELLPELFVNEALTSSEKDEVKKQPTNALKNTKLLGYIDQNVKHREFLEALRKSGQIHVVNWIEANGSNYWIH